MTLPQETVGLLHEVRKATDLQTNTPSPHTLFDLYNRLVDVYARLGEEQVKRFSAKEAAYIRRKIEAGKAYQKGRIDKLTSKDAEIKSWIEVENELIKENEASELYEELRVLRGSVDRAISYIQSLRSYISNSEKL